MLCAGSMAARHRDNSVVPVPPEPWKMHVLQRGESRIVHLIVFDSLRSITCTAPLIPLMLSTQPGEVAEYRDGLLLPADSSVDFRSRLWKARSSGVY
jgi:hypothetical protein